MHKQLPDKVKSAIAASLQQASAKGITLSQHDDELVQLAMLLKDSPLQWTRDESLAESLKMPVRSKDLSNLSALGPV